MIGTLLMAAALASAPTAIEIEAPGPSGALKGTMLTPAAPNPRVILIIPGSGPTDRDGNSPMGVLAAPYRLLAEGLAARGIATVRIDKRGMFGSRAAIADPNAVTVRDYAADVASWVAVIRRRTGARCVWLLGHSEGAMVVLSAAGGPDVCGIVAVSGAGRPLGTILREQLKANPANAPVLDQAFAALDQLEAGNHVNTTHMNPGLLSLFAPQVQDYLIDLLAIDPAKLAAKVRVPLLIVQGDHDLQIGVPDAERLKRADPAARLVIVPGMNHVLKFVAGDDPQRNFATYGDPSLPLAPGLIDAVAAFVKQPR